MNRRRLYQMLFPAFFMNHYHLSSSGFTADSESLMEMAQSQNQKNRKRLPVPGHQFEIQGHQAFLIAPENSRNQEKGKKWLWYAPTLLPYPGPEEKWMIEKFLSSGISIAGIDVGESYGSPAGTKIFSAFYDDMTNRLGYSQKPSLLCRSRGGLMLYNWAADHPSQVSCIAGIYPVCNMESWPGLEKAAPAYGISAESLKKELSKHNPVDRINELAREKVPIFHIHGDSDTVVPLESNSQLLASRYQKLGGPITLSVPEGQGHNMWTGFFQCRELVDFVIQNSQSE